MSTDFSQWNPNGTGQENDATYQADSQRSGGAAPGSPFAHVLANKLFYQVTTFIRAFALMMVGKGFNLVDGTSPFTADTSSNAAVTALQTLLTNVLTTSDTQTYKRIGATPSTTHGLGQALYVMSIPVAGLVSTSNINIKMSFTWTSSGSISAAMFFGSNLVDDIGDNDSSGQTEYEYNIFINSVSGSNYNVVYYGKCTISGTTGVSVLFTSNGSTVIAATGGNLVFTIKQSGGAGSLIPLYALAQVQY